jgi:selenocysteine-specific elongation factor
VRGSGTVVTGTLAAGRLRVGDELEVVSLGRTARGRALRSLNQPVSEVDAVARVPVSLCGVERHEPRRGDALLTPRRFHLSDTIDVRLHGDPVAPTPHACPSPARCPFGSETAACSEIPGRITSAAA